jgi:putative flippase GtrA
MFRRLLPLIKSIPVSLICFSLDYGLLFFLTENVHLYYLLSSALSFTLANTLNFYLCARWVFPNSSRRRHQYPLFLFVGAVGLALNTALMAIFTSGLHWYYMFSKIIASSIVFFWNYFLRKNAIFREI